MILNSTDHKKSIDRLQLKIDFLPKPNMRLSKEIWKTAISKQEQFRKRCRPGMQNCTHTSYLSSYNLKTTIKVRKCSHVTTTSKLNQVFPTHQKMVIIRTDDYICFISLHTREVCKINTRNIFQPQLHFNWINFFSPPKANLKDVSSSP